MLLLLLLLLLLIEPSLQLLKPIFREGCGRARPWSQEPPGSCCSGFGQSGICAVGSDRRAAGGHATSLLLEQLAQDVGMVGRGSTVGRV